MDYASKIFTLLFVVTLIWGLIVNLSPNLPRFPWDINIDRPGFRIYIPITSALVSSVILSILFNLF